MAILKLEQRIKAHADMVWRTIADVSGLAEVATQISRVEILEGEGVGMKRRVFDNRGDSWIEECIDWQEGQSYTMRVDTSEYPFAIAEMEYTWGLEERSGGVVLIRMMYDYVPKGGAMGALLDRVRIGTRFRSRFEETCSRVMENWVRVIHAREWAYQVTVATILEKKGHDIISTTKDSDVGTAAQMLQEHRIGAVLVIDDDGKMLGLVSERDVVRAIGLHGSNALEKPCWKIMTSRVIVCHPEDNMLQVMACMSERRFRHLPVVDQDDDLVGIISIGDVVQTRVHELEAESESLKHYISARRWRELYLELGPAALGQENATNPDLMDTAATGMFKQ